MTRRAVVFVESNTTGTGMKLMERAIERDFHCFLLAVDATRYRAPRGVTVLEADTCDFETLVTKCEEIARGAELCGITSTSEYFIEVANRLAERFARPHVSSEAVARARMKSLQRDLLAAAGLPVPRYQSHKRGRSAELRGLGPYVVKPVMGSGSVGVRLCSDAREALEYANELIRQERDERGAGREPRALVESYIEGPEFSVEVMNGHVFGVVAKQLGPLPDFVETGHDFPAPVSKELREQMERVALRAVECLALSPGPAYVELRVDQEGRVVLIEVNPRLAGGMIPELIRRATGEDLLVRLLGFATGTRFSGSSEGQGAASLRFFTSSREGRVKDVRPAERCQGLPGVVEAVSYKPSGAVYRKSGDFRDRLGHVIAVADNTREAAMRAEVARSSVGDWVEEEERSSTEALA